MYVPDGVLFIQSTHNCLLFGVTLQMWRRDALSVFTYKMLHDFLEQSIY